MLGRRPILDATGLAFSLDEWGVARIQVERDGVLSNHPPYVPRFAEKRVRPNVCLNKNGQQVAVCTPKGLTIFDTAKLEKAQAFPNLASSEPVCFSDDGSLLAIIPGGSHSTLIVLDVALGTTHRVVEIHDHLDPTDRKLVKFGGSDNEFLAVLNGGTQTDQEKQLGLEGGADEIRIYRWK